MPPNRSKVESLIAARPTDLTLRADAAASLPKFGADAALLGAVVVAALLLPISPAMKLAVVGVASGAFIAAHVVKDTTKQLRFLRESMRFINSSNAEDAVEFCATWTRGQAKPSHSMGLVQTAYAMVRAGNLPEALAIYSEVDRTATNRAIKRPARAGVASILALLGYPDEALEKIETLGVDDTGLPFARTLINVCQERYEDVLRLRLNPRSERRTELLVHEIRAIMLMRALAAARLGRDREIELRFLGAAHPAREGEYDYLRAHIAALAIYLDAVDWPRVERTAPSFDSAARLPTALLRRG